MPTRPTAIQGPTLLSDWEEVTIDLSSPQRTIYSKDVDDNDNTDENEREFQAAILRYAQMLNTTADEIGLTPSEVDKQVQELATQSNSAKDTAIMTSPVVSTSTTPLGVKRDEDHDLKWLDSPEGRAKLRELVEKMNELSPEARQAFLMKVPANIRAALLAFEKETRVLTEVRRSISFNLSEEPAPRFDPSTFTPENRHWLGRDGGQTQQPLGPTPENDPDRNHKLYDEPFPVWYDRELNQAQWDADVRTHTDPQFADIMSDLRANDF